METGSDVGEGLAESPNLLRPIHFVQPARYPGDGVTINKFGDQNDDYVFMAGFFEDGNELRLIRRDGTIVARWPVKFSEIFTQTSHLNNPPVTDWNIDIHGARMLADGSAIFNFEYGGLVKLDHCGNLLWTLEKPTHHTVALSQRGGFWVPGRRFHEAGVASEFPPFTPPFSEDTLLLVSNQGEVILEISVPGLFYANGLEFLLTANGETIHPRDKWDEELVHLNSVTELTDEIAADFPDFKSGDLLISLREYNMILVFNPDSRKIKWWQIGPWVRQHDPTFVSGGKMLVFNNNIYRAAFGHNKIGVSDVDVPRVSNIMEYDFKNQTTKIVYGTKADQELLSIERGKKEMAANGGLLITEFEGGRVFETDRSGQIVWQYINRFDNNLIAEISTAHVYPGHYFKGLDWTCPE